MYSSEIEDSRAASYTKKEKQYQLGRIWIQSLRIPSTRAQVTAPDIYTGQQGEPGTLPGGMLLLQEAELLCSGRYHELWDSCENM